MEGRASIEVGERQIDAIFAHLNHCHLPGAAVGIAIGGRPVYRKAFGMASSELPVGLSPNMKMRIGSITKHFACLAYLLICERGKAGIDDPIGKYLPEVHPASRGVTIRQLMGHVSGIRDASDICWHFSGTGRPVSSSELLSLYRTINDVNATPGTTWIYNNGGYHLLSAAIERITNRSLEDVLRETIFRPVGMYDTALRRFDTDFVFNSATLHTPKPDKTFEKAYFGTALVGEGGMVSTVDDMLLWLNHMSSPEIGSLETWNSLKRPLTLINGMSTGYGLGLISDRYGDFKTIGHSGGVLGGTADMLKVVAADLDVVVLVNRSDVMAPSLTYGILDACLNTNRTVESPGGSRATGIFRSRITGRVIQLLGRDGQQIASIDGTDITVNPDSDGVLHPELLHGYLRFSITLLGGAKTPTQILFEDFGNRDELSAVQPDNDTSASSIAGRYRSGSTGTEIAIHLTDDGANMKSVGRFGSVEYDLEYLAKGIWRSRSAGYSPWAGLLTFDQDNLEFRYTNLRIRALPFRRVG